MNWLNAVLQVISVGFWVSAIGQMWYWLFLFGRLRRYCAAPPVAPLATGDAPLAVSVIICAKNEAANLRKNLPLFLAQQYAGAWELLVVDDHSTDATAQVLAELAREHPPEKLRILTLRNEKRDLHGKKFALSRGIEAARYGWVLLTDADCRPCSADWVRQMCAARRGERQRIVLGYSPYEVAPNWLNRFIRFETVYAAVQYFSFALWEMAYMGVGRNLLYDKGLYYRAGGFERHGKLASGDDDLFVNAVAAPQTVGVCLQPSAYIFSDPKATVSGYIRQKKRHLTTSTHYRPQHIALLGALSLTHIWVYAGLFLNLTANNLPFLSLTLFLLRWAVMAHQARPIFGHLQAADLWKWLPLLDAFYAFYLIYMSPGMLDSKKDKWN